MPSAIANGNADPNPSADAYFNTELYAVGDADGDSDTDADSDSDTDSDTSGDTSEYSNPAASRVESDTGIL